MGSNNLEYVSITCVGCQFNSGVKILEEAGCINDLSACMESIDLIPQPDNKYNPNAIAWCWVERTEKGYDEYIIGYVPDDELDEVWELLNEYEAVEVPSTIIKLKRNGRNEIQWIQFGCTFEEKEGGEVDMGYSDNMTFRGFNRG